MKVRTAKTLCLFGMALLLIASACTHPISKQLRKEAQKDNLLFATVLADPAAYKGRIVLWGGRVIEITNNKAGTEMIVLETPLDFLGVPEAAQSSRGRFIARIPKFLDPAIYLADRDITLAGEVVGAEEKELGETTYKYPVVMIKELHLWEKLDPKYPTDTWHDPLGGANYNGTGPYYRLGERP
jgi:outer membrane lipoprotein